MALPKLNDVPRYPLTIPSTGKEVMFRPFLVKEQKVLLMAMESQDEKQILNAIIDTIGACVYDKINLDKLATFDVEYMFIKIRSKSAGETSKVNAKCRDCGEFSAVEIKLDEIEIDVKNSNKVIKINDNYSLIMKYPNYTGSLLMVDESETETFTSSIFKMIKLSLDKLQTEDELLEFANETEEEIDNFIDSLSAEHLESLTSFILTLPKLQHVLNFKCESCHYNNTLTLQGIQDFF